jgi:hypothetical protein
MLQIISALDFGRYTPRVYIISEGDVLSANKAVHLEDSRPIAAGTDSVSQPSLRLISELSTILPEITAIHHFDHSTGPTRPPAVMVYTTFSTIFCSGLDILRHCATSTPGYTFRRCHDPQWTGQLLQLMHGCLCQ